MAADLDLWDKRFNKGEKEDIEPEESQIKFIDKRSSWVVEPLESSVPEKEGRVTRF